MNDSQPPATTATTETSDEQCMVCLNALREEEQLWTCSCCHKKCHMLCTFQWTLRLSLNRSRNFSSFTCPGCRTGHAIATLPGFAQHAPAPIVAPPRRSNANASTADILRRAFGVTTATDAATTQSNDALVTEENGGNDDDVSDDDEDDDDTDSDDDSDDDTGRWRFSVSTEKIYFDIRTLNINIRS